MTEATTAASTRSVFSAKSFYQAHFSGKVTYMTSLQNMLRPARASELRRQEKRIADHDRSKEPYWSAIA